MVATIKASLPEIERFAAHHLELGAHRVHIYLDAPEPATVAALSALPRLRVVPCDTAYWAKRGRRPAKHQVRQTRNATRAYRRRPEVDWLAHIDVDEFLWPTTDIAGCLAALPPDTLCARVRPMEMLAGGDGTAFKAFVPPGPGRTKTARRLYPTYGDYVNGGFLSHVAGKLFVRTGMDGIEFRIHNVFRHGEQNPGQTELDDIALCHAHAPDLDAWLAGFRYRLEHGAYRAELGPGPSGRTLHDVLRHIEAAEGEVGLRAFHAELCADTPDLRARLRAEGLLRLVDLGLEAARRRQFPQTGGN